ncbi:hypothetical protein PRCB_17650 [Pantoea rodasii]|uniref:Uncharacterized protein n=1 Tax=Pantoea rodasii TaxID=1076549 RepID=A0A2M9W988_9GAMM|nr:hypothetical protein HA45_12790 [Pantoea rodasii]PJZ04101.1 hypothetical protein PRCB_17650 [Pantoea rodasii]
MILLDEDKYTIFYNRLDLTNENPLLSRAYLIQTQEIIELLSDFNQKVQNKPLPDIDRLRKIAELACCVWDLRIQALPHQTQPSEERRIMDSHKLRSMAKTIGLD